LKKSNTLASADGKPLQELGKAIFDIQLGDLNFDIELIVADIEDEALLGLDVPNVYQSRGHNNRKLLKKIFHRF
jgi:hypothetical protein